SADDELTEIRNMNVAIRTRKLAFELGSDVGHLSAGLVESYVGLEASEDAKAIALAACGAFAERHGCPDFRFGSPEWGEAEGFGHHADDGIRLTVKLDVASEDVRVGREATLPD